MALDANYFQFRGFAFRPDSISFGDGETVEININRGGTITKIPVIKRTVTFTIVGATSTDLALFENERSNNIDGLISGAASFEDIDIFGYELPNSILTKVTPSKPFKANGIELMDEIQLQFDSQTFR
jgi:hypothetical protein